MKSVFITFDSILLHNDKEWNFLLASSTDLWIWFHFFCFWLFGHWYCLNINKRIWCINLCYSYNMSKSTNNCIIIYALFKTIYFRVWKHFLIIITFISFLSYVWSGLIVVFGIYLNVYSRNQALFDAKIASIIHSLFGFRWTSKYSQSTTSRTLPV